MRLMRIDCELYNKRNCVIAVLHMGTFQDHVQRDFLVVSQDVEKSTIPFFTLLERNTASNKELRKWPHLDGASLPEIEEHQVSILVGSDRQDIIDDNSEIRRGARGQLYAVNTPLGWTVYGPMGGPDSDGVHVNFVTSDHEEL